MRRFSNGLRPARLESLEPRRLLAAEGGTIVFDPASSGSVTVTGTDANDVIRAERVGVDDVRFTVNSTSQTFDLDDFGTISLRGRGGDDSITAVGDLSRVVLVLDGGSGNADTLSTTTPSTFLWNGEILRDGTRTVATRQGDGTLLITGTGGNDVIELTHDTEGENIRVNAFRGVVVGSEYTAYFAAAGGGDDRIVVGNAFPGSAATRVTVSGETGNDTFEIAGGAIATVLGGANDDLLRVLGGDIDVDGLPNITAFEGGTGDDTIELTGHDDLDLNDYPDVENVVGARGTVTGNALGNRIVAAPSDTAGVVFRGGGGPDELVGAGGPDQLFGEADNDTLRGNGGNDLLDGGADFDFADGGPGDDTITNAEDGPDGREPNTISAGLTRVEVNGTAGNDVILVEQVGTDDVRITLNSTVRTFDMDDVGGDYILRGLGGNDSITIRGNIRAVTRTLDGGEDTDTLTGTDAYFLNGEVIRDPAGRLVVERDPIEGFLVHGTAGNDTIQLHDLGDGPLVRVNTFSGIIPGITAGGAGRYVLAGAGNDRVVIGSFFPGTTLAYGDDGNDVFDVEPNTLAFVYGGNGDDTLFARGETFEQISLFEAGGGVDTIQFDGQTRLANDTLDAFDWENVTNARGTVFGNALDNRIVADPADTAGVVFRGGGGDDTLIGAGGPDQLFGEDDDDTLIGNAGNDTLDGGPGIDRLDGGAGTNTLRNGENSNLPQFFIENAGPGTPRNLTAYGTLGNDTMTVVRTGADDVRVTVNGVSRTFDMDDFDQIILYGGPGNDAISAGAGVEEVFLFGKAGDDRLTGNDLLNRLIGGGGNDTITANGGNDFVEAGAGNDTVDGGAGNDQLRGGDGDDTLTGGAGADEMYGELGSDTLFARDGVIDNRVDGGFVNEGGTDRAQVDPGDPLFGIEQVLP